MKLCPNTTIAVRWKFAETNKTLPDSNGSKNYSADNAHFVFFTRLPTKSVKSVKIAKSAKSANLRNPQIYEIRKSTKSAFKRAHSSPISSSSKSS